MNLMTKQSLEYCARKFRNYSESSREPLKQKRSMIKLCSTKKILVVIYKSEEQKCIGLRDQVRTF